MGTIKKGLAKQNPLCITGQNAQRVSRALFYVSLFLLLAVNQFIGSSLYGQGDTQFVLFVRSLLWIPFGLALVNILFLCRYSIGQLLGIAAFIALWLVIYKSSGNQLYTLPPSMALAFSCGNVKWKDVLKHTMWMWALLFIATALLCAAGVFPMVIYHRNGMTRYSLGAAHPNQLGATVLCFVFLWVMLRYNRLRPYEYALWLALAAFCWFVPNSRTATVSILLIILLTLLSKAAKGRLLESRLVRWLCVAAPAAAAALSVLGSYFYNAGSVLYAKVDRIVFTGRLGLAHGFFDAYNVKLFGQRIKMVPLQWANEHNVPARIIDCFYGRMLMNGGAVGLCAFMLVYLFLVYRAARNRDHGLVIMLLVGAFFSIYESYFICIAFFIALFQLAYQILPQLREQGRPLLKRE